MLKTKYSYSLDNGIQKIKSRTSLIITAMTMAISGGGAATVALSGVAHAASSTVCATSCTADDLQAAFNSASPGDTVTLGGDVTLNHEVKINKSLTFDGDGHTVNGAFAKTDNDNNASVGVISTSGVTIKDLTVDGSAGTDLHGVNVYVSTNVLLDNVTLQDNGRYGMVVNGSSVTVNNITTKANGYGGVDVDQGKNVTQKAKLIVDGVSKQNEAYGRDIFIDSVASGATVVDTNNQYVYVDSTNAVPHDSRTYTLLNNIDQCKNNGYVSYKSLAFKNQGQCVSYVQHNANGHGKPAANKSNN